MIKLENMHKSYFDCFEDCLTSIIQYYKKDYMYIFAEAWRVNTYSSEVKNQVTELLLFTNACGIADKYCGLKSDIRSFYKYDYYEKYLIECIEEGKPVIISVDLYDLPWSEYYKKIHSNHFIIVYHYLGNHKFLIFDVTKQKDNIEIDLLEVFDGKICTVVISENGNNEEIQVEDIINHCKQLLQMDVEENDGYKYLYYIAEHYFKEDHKLFDLACEDVETEPFINRLVYFGRQRLAFSEFLKHLASKTGDMSYQGFIDELGALGAKWLTFRNKLMKIRLKGNFEEKKEEINNLWISLVEKDKALYEKFIHYDKTNVNFENSLIDIKRMQADVINIRSHLNSNAFNSQIWNNKKGFDFNGYYYELNQGEMFYDEANCNIKFYIDQEKDNISCNKQNITIQKSDVKAVMVIGSCENGDYSEELTFIYENDEEDVSLIFPDWWEHNRFNEKVVRKLNCCRLIDNTIQNKGEVYIVSQLLTIKNGVGNLLKSIRLPECTNMHIFGFIVYY